MLKRLNTYLREMFPVPKQIVVSTILFFEIYFLVVFLSDVRDFYVGIPEIVGCITIFVFFLTLRIADDFKDYKHDKRLFAHRPLPSGRVYKKDLVVLLVLANITALVLNIIYMNNFLFYVVFMGFALLMSVWFFARDKIQKNLLLALVTHNPVAVIMNFYIISFACIKYDLPLWSLNNVLIALTLYWPSLIWEITRKTRAPEDETEYVTYSSLFGYKKVMRFVLLIITFDVITSAKIMYELWTPGVVAVVAAYVWFVVACLKFMKNPKVFKIVSRIEIYELITEVPVIMIQIALILRWIV